MVYSFDETKGKELTYIQKGVLWVQEEPYYIIEKVIEPNITYVIVYDVHPDTKSNPKKKAELKTKKAVSYSDKTLLGKIANKLKPQKKTKKWVPKPPLFIAPVIPNYQATLTGKWESGFFERLPDEWTVREGKKVLVRGKNTGVFIGLSSVDWEDKIVIPAESVVKSVHSMKEAFFFDFEGDNDNTDNPLSSYYGKGRRE